MPRITRRSRLRLATVPAAVVSTIVAAAVLAGVTLAKTFTLNVTKNATVLNTSTHKTVHENIVVDSQGRSVYWLSGDTKAKPKCTKANGCFQFWPPVTVASAAGLSKAAGVPGKLGTWRRNGLIQVTLGGHPLYRFSYDSVKGHATGDGVKSFGGTWSVVKATTSGSTGSTGSSGSTGSTGPGW